VISGASYDLARHHRP